MEEKDILMRTTTVARILAVSDDTVRRWFDEGILQGMEKQNRNRRTIRIYKSSVDLFRETPGK